MDGQGSTWRRNIAEKFNRLSRAHERYKRQTTDRQTTDRQTTDGRPMTYSEHELEFTFAENVAIAMHCNLRLPYNELVVLCFNYDTVPRMKSVNYPFLSCGVLMLIRNVRM